MQTFDQSLFDLYEGYYITYEDALRNADSVNDLRLHHQAQQRCVRAAMTWVPASEHLSDRVDNRRSVFQPIFTDAGALP